MREKLETIASQLNNARTPEDVFGYFHEKSADCLPALKEKYHALARVVHPDFYKSADEKILANLALSQLNTWYRRACEKTKLGLYGQDADKPELVALQARDRLYWVEAEYSQDAEFNYHPCLFKENGLNILAVLKIVRDPHDNELAQAEAAALNDLSQHASRRPGFSAYFPSLLDGFVYTDESAEHNALVFEPSPGWHSLEDVRRAYPAGIDPKDMAWIWRRLLTALGFAHKNGWLHGAVLPRNVLIEPEQHGLMLINWSRARPIPAADWSPAADNVMSAECMLFLLGGEPAKRLYPASLPEPLKNFLRGTLLPAQRAPRDAWALKEEFDELVEHLWGRRKFHPFVMK
jgi:serine/threonine protein kinase